MEQQERGVATPLLDERDLGAQQVQARSPQLVERPGLSRRQQLAGDVERAGPEGCLRCGERSFGSPGGIVAQRDRTLQERGRGRGAAPGLRAAGGALELDRDLLVGSRGRGRQVPSSAIWIDPAVRCLRQRQVRGPSLIRSR